MLYITIIIVGFSNGIVVGSGIVALLTLLDIIPRLAQLTNTYEKIPLYEHIIIVTSSIIALLSLLQIGVNIGAICIVIIGFSMGIFIGMLASALAEVMHVIPVIVRRFNMEDYVDYVVYALIFGKVIGSLLQYLFNI